MAFGVSTLTEGGTDTNGTFADTASVSPTYGSWVLVIWACYDTALVAAEDLTVTGLSLSWTPIAFQGFTGNWGGASYAFVPKGTGAGAIRLTSPSSTTIEGYVWHVLQVTGVGGVQQASAFTASNRTTTDSLALVALGALRSNPNAVMGWFCSYDNAGGALTISPDAGWSTAESTSQAMDADTTAILTLYATNTADTTPSVTVNAANDRLWGGAIEWIVADDKSSADTGAGTDAPSGLGISHADSGAGTETQAGVGLSGSDLGAGTDGASALALADAESGTGSDELAILALSHADTGAGAEAAAVALSHADTGSGAEGSSLDLSHADTGAGSDAVDGLALSEVDTGSGADALGILALSHDDASVSAETVALALSHADLGSWVENTLVVVTTSDGDLIFSQDAIQLLDMASSEFGSSAEAISLAAAVTAADSGIFTDSVVILAAQVSDSDVMVAVEFGSYISFIPTIMDLQLRRARLLPGWEITAVARGAKAKEILEGHGVKVVSPGWVLREVNTGDQGLIG